MDCAEFERRLDEAFAKDAASSATAELHVAACERCAALLAEAQWVEAALSAKSLPAPDGFADRVMTRVAIEPRPDPSIAGLRPSPALAWWVRVAADPAVVLSMLLAAILVWSFGRVGSISGLLDSR